MESFLKEKPRTFNVNGIDIKDYGQIKLAPNEMITLETPSGRSYDITAKDFGFYATPSINARLVTEGFKTALVKNAFEKVFILMVEIDNIDKFNRYCISEKLQVIFWIDEMSFETNP